MLNTPSRQDPALLSSMDPAQIARAVQHCPIPLDSALQVRHLFEEYKYHYPIPLRHHISNLFLSLDSFCLAEICQNHYILSVESFRGCLCLGEQLAHSRVRAIVSPGDQNTCLPAHVLSNVHTSLHYI